MRIAAMVALGGLVGCGPGVPDPDFARYRGEVLVYEGQGVRFPVGTVEAIQRAGDRLVWTRVVPDGLSSRDLIERYLIDLGRTDTGRQGPSGYQLGYASFLPGDERTDLGDGYTLHCTRADQRVPAFNCAALLRSLPRAAIAFAPVPRSAREARAMVDEAEAFMRRATPGSPAAAGSPRPDR